MKKIKLTQSLEGKISSGFTMFFSKDVELLGERFVPGEWLFLEGSKIYLACANPFGSTGPIIRISGDVQIENWKSIEDHALQLLKVAIDKRRVFGFVENGCRLFYGEQDGLSGLVIDAYKNTIILNISSCGIWNIREDIKNFLVSEFKEKKVYITIAKGANSFEEIPGESDKLEEEFLSVVENEFAYEVSADVIQKAGYYYDHRQNRQKMENFLKRYQYKLKNGLDLFSYVGSWGLHLLRSGCDEVEFIDQANLETSIQRSLDLNNYSNRGSFLRSDVYRALDAKIEKGIKYDIVVSDPPAFTKSQNAKESALRGYEKLHHKSLQILNKQGVYVAASCTSHVSLTELDETVQSASKRLDRSITLADIGIQGEDHMMQGLRSRSNYIKYLLYIVWE